MSYDKSKITRHFITIENKRQIHFRKAGNGPPVLLLHQSPKSSKELIPVINSLKDKFTCIAPDTPGNGNSDPIGLDKPTMVDYGKNIKLFLDALSIKKVCVYGFHTGASVGGSFASQFPERVNIAVLNGFVALNAEERNDIMQNYLTPLEYKWDGSHLLWSWTRLREQHIFFPWYRISEETRMKSDLPDANQIHDNLMEFFRAGDEYRKPYGAAFMFEGDRVAPTFKSPTIICASDWDPTVRFLDRLPDNLPSNVSVQRLGEKRGKAVTDWLEEIFLKYASGESPKITEPKSLNKTFYQDFVNVDGIQLHMIKKDGSERPLLFHHEIGDDNSSLKRFSKRKTNLVSFSLPGHGESDSIELSNEFDLEPVYDLLSRAIKKIGLDDLDIIALQNSASIALGVSQKLSNHVNNLYLMNFPYFTQMDKKSYYNKFAFDIVPSSYGEHLIKCWNFLRDQALYFPWFDNKKENIILNEKLLKTTDLHNRLVSLLKAKDSWKKMYNLLINIDEINLINSCKANVVFAGESSFSNDLIKTEYKKLNSDSKWQNLSEKGYNWIDEF